MGVQEQALRQRERGLRQERDNVRQQLDAAQQEVDANAQVGSDTCIHIIQTSYTPKYIHCTVTVRVGM